MVAKRFAWALCLTWLVPSLAQALGLGEIRLASALNEPLRAEIELLNAAPDELVSLQASLANRETFARFGLDYPAFLNSVTLERGKSSAGRDVIVVRSAETVTEPFVSLLVEVNWGRGRLVREYTVLLDPPVFAPNTPRVAEPTAPTTGSASSGSIVRPAPAAAEPAQPDSANAGAADAAATYMVRRGDSLGVIAQQLASGSGVAPEQMMLGLFQANPDAFEGNMNQLRAGAILRVPGQDTVQATSVAAASAEVRRQYASWRGGVGGSAASGSGRLRLVAPGEGGGAAGGATANDVRALRDRLAQLEGELAESKRLIELRNAELATLQQQLAARGGVAPTPAPQPQPAQPAAAAPEVSESTASQPSDAASGTVPAEPAATPAPPATAVEEPMRARIRTEETAKDAGGPSIVDSIISGLSEYWFIPAGLLVLLGGIFGLRKYQESRAAQDALSATAGFASAEAAPAPVFAPAPVVETSGRPAKPASSMLVEESGEHETVSFSKAPVSPVSRAPVRGDAMVEGEPSVTLSGDTAVNLDQGDPLAEADFHMAYGLYDQAADLVKNATVREPQRLDLKLKLVEVFFVWGNKDEFLRLAREIHKSGLATGSGDWEKIVIMGRQIAPEEPLFSEGASVANLANNNIDLNLSGGDSRLDFDVVGEAARDAVDLDLGGAATSSSDLDLPPLDDQDTQAVANLDVTINQDPTGVTTRQMAKNLPPAVDLPELADFDLDLSGGSESPTVEQPALRAGSPTIREKIDATRRVTPAAGDEVNVESTSEVAIDDLGLDIGEVDGLDLSEAVDDTPSDAPTLVSGVDADARRRMQGGAPRPGTGGTSLLAALDGASAGDLDFQLNDIANDKTVERPVIGAAGNGRAAAETALLDLDLGGVQGDSSTLIADDVSLPSLEPVTMSEVGTKLDLARAYVDMGDPDGARNILQEVLQEGSMSQKQEAQRLLDSIPG